MFCPSPPTFLMYINTDQKHKYVCQLNTINLRVHKFYNLVFSSLKHLMVGVYCIEYFISYNSCVKLFVFLDTALRSFGCNDQFFWCTLPGGADKSLARPGRKQATATKLGIYSTYSQRSSIHFLARCSNFCKSLQKKKSVGCPSNQVSAAKMTSASEENWRFFNYFFSPGNRW